MTRRIDGLFPSIASFSALEAAARRAACGKRRKPGVAAFLARLEREVLRLERELLAGTWRPGCYVEIAIRDPKPRTVSAAPFRDRVVHHALCAVIEPIFERGFVFDSYANRRGKGTHRAVAGYVLLPNGRRRLPEDNVRRFRNRLRGMRDRVRAGVMTIEEARPRVASWVAHARHANTRRLRRTLLRGGPFDPAAHGLSGHPAAPPGWTGSLAGP